MCSQHLQQYKDSAQVLRSVRRVSRMEPVGAAAAAVVPVADTKVRSLTINSLQCLS